MEARARVVQYYRTADEREPFNEWLERIDRETRNRVRIKLNRVEKGNLGENRGVGEGVKEMVLDFGPGYRLYFGEDGNDVVMLLGGSKSSQSRDISLAKIYWRDYRA